GPDLLSRANHRRRWRRARRDDFQSLLEPDAMRGAVLRQAAYHHRSAAQVSDALYADHLDDLFGIHLALADIARPGRSHGPSKAPAVAMEQRHCPKIDRPRIQAVLHQFTERVQ